MLRHVHRKLHHGILFASSAIAPENAGNHISEALRLNIFRGRMPPDPPRDYRLRRAFIRTLLRQILNPPQSFQNNTSRALVLWLSCCDCAVVFCIAFVADYLFIIYLFWSRLKKWDTTKLFIQSKLISQSYRRCSTSFNVTRTVWVFYITK